MLRVRIVGRPQKLVPSFCRLVHRASASTSDPWNSLISSRINTNKDTTSAEKNTVTGSSTSCNSSTASTDAASSPAGSLSGTTYIAKDNIVTTHEFSTGASRILSNYRSPFDATVVLLLDAAGSTLLGKSNLDEFGMGSSTTNSHYGTTLNPLYSVEVETGKAHISGGSSGGSAAAVAGKLANYALGTDTGGSVRQPASYCGTVGFKPTYGRISRWGVISYAQTLDTVGIISDDIHTVEKVYHVLDKYDDKDPTSLPDDIRNSLKSKGTEDVNNTSLTVGVPREFVVGDLSQEVKEVWFSVLSQLQDMGHTVKIVSVPSIKQSLSSYYTLATAEAASNLSRYDGVRYGQTTEDLQEKAHDLIVANRTNGFGPEVQRRILLGNYTLSSESGDHYIKATQVREKLVNEFNQVFNLRHVFSNDTNVDKETSGRCDILVAPTAINSAPTLKEYHQQNETNFLNDYVNDILTVPASLAGLPTISIPRGKHGIQIMGQFGADQTVLDVSKKLMEVK
ncbi:hypothetical protein G9P44_000828 [Scheffersomyces stipitis]|nr:hypothetical protein G9P44_000828 [Scheffersomyces stipitis]